MTEKRIVRLVADPEGFGQSADELSSDSFASDFPVQHTHDYYLDENLGLNIGVGDTTDMIEAPGPYACDKLMFLLEGEALFLPEGVVCRARVTEKLMVIFAVCTVQNPWQM